jgi:large subunit ribosomal protein L22
MLSPKKLKEFCRQRKMSVEVLAGHLVRAGLDKKAAISALQNWQRGLIRPIPTKDDVSRLASALGVEAKELSDWHSSCMYAPMSARKVRLVTQLVAGRKVQEAIDVLKFTRKRAAPMVDQVLKSAVADADEQQAKVDNLYISEARVDDAGIRMGTKRWIAKDRGRAHPFNQRACHIHITVTQSRLQGR